MKIEDINEIDVPLMLADILAKRDPPILISRDNWLEKKMIFRLEHVASSQDGKLRYFGRFIFDGVQQSGTRELNCTFCKYRVVKE